VIGVTAAVVPDRGADVLGHRVDPLQQVLDALLLEFWMLLERGVQVGDVSRVMFVVVDPHRLLVDVRLEGVVVVRKRGNCVRHADSFSVCLRDSAQTWSIRSSARRAWLFSGSGTTIWFSTWPA